MTKTKDLQQQYKEILNNMHQEGGTSNDENDGSRQGSVRDTKESLQERPANTRGFGGLYTGRRLDEPRPRKLPRGVYGLIKDGRTRERILETCGSLREVIEVTSVPITFERAIKF